jgi:hypothetical protein
VTETEALCDERDELTDRIGQLNAQRDRLDCGAEEWDAIGDELGPLLRRLDEIEETLGWDEWRQERRNTPIW